MNLFRKNDKTKNKHELNKIGNGEFESKLIKKDSPVKEYVIDAIKDIMQISKIKNIGGQIG